MTLIAGYTDGRSWAIGGDSGAFEVSGLYQAVAEPKVWRAGASLIGGAGSFRIIDLAKKSGLANPYDLRDHLKEANVAGEWSLLVVTKKSLFEIDDELGVVRLKDNYSAIGIANSVAIGALSVLSQNKYEAKLAVKKTMETTARHQVNCVPPFHILVQV